LRDFSSSCAGRRTKELSKLIGYYLKRIQLPNIVVAMITVVGNLNIIKFYWLLFEFGGYKGSCSSYYCGWGNCEGSSGSSLGYLFLHLRYKYQPPTITTRPTVATAAAVAKLIAAPVPAATAVVDAAAAPSAATAIPPTAAPSAATAAPVAAAPAAVEPPAANPDVPMPPPTPPAANLATPTAIAVPEAAFPELDDYPICNYLGSFFIIINQSHSALS